jgi:outer membrane protein assembly factor BamD (BamD/ComL family)
LEDYESAITTLEGFVLDYTYNSHIPEALFYLRYCYTKTGQTQKAADVAANLKQQYPGTEFDKIASNTTGAISEDSARTLDMNKRYESIYNKFIEGNFEGALAEKKTADSLYDKSYWTPQLLYIEALYYVRQRQDINARRALNELITNFGESPMAAKAKTMADVISRRKEIEDYLTNLKIERPTEDSMVIIVDPAYRPSVSPNPPLVQNPATVRPKDSTLTNQPVQQPPVTANTQQQTPPTNTDRKTTQQPPPPILSQKPLDSPRVTTSLPKVYVLDTAATHVVALVLDKVDPVYVTETRNAFNRYNREQGKGALGVNPLPLTDDTRLVLIDGFRNAAEALIYMDRARKLAASDIIPWLPANKYSFIIISHNNLPVLSNLKDIGIYKSFLTQSYPGRF